MKTLGWIGLGHMGAPMALNLLKAGFTVNVYNRTSEKAKSLVSAGAVQLKSPKEVIENSDITFLMLSNPAAIRDVLIMENGILEGITKDKVVIDMSTVAPEDSVTFSETLSKSGGIYVDAPVSGSVGAAKAAQLVILVGADEEACEEYEPFLKHLGKKIIPFGGIGKGSSAKLSINLLLGVLVQGIAESLVYSEKAGLDREKVFEMIFNSGLSTGLFQAKIENYRKEDFPSEFMVELMTKDLGLIQRDAERLDLELPLSGTNYATFLEAKGNGKGKLDFTGIYKEIKDRNI